MHIYYRNDDEIFKNITKFLIDRYNEFYKKGEL